MKSVETLEQELYRTLDREKWRKHFSVVYSPFQDRVQVLNDRGRIYETLMRHCDGILVGAYDNSHYYPHIAKDMKQAVNEYRNEGRAYARRSNGR